jgi:hypothetical protein
MGIFEQLEALDREINSKPAPDAWAHAEDRLEEWIGAEPLEPKVKRAKKVRAPQAPPGQIVTDLTLIKDVKDLYQPKDFKNSVDYARALKLYSARIAPGQYAGYLVSVTMDGIIHNRRVCEPIRSREEALKSPDFMLAMTKSIEAIMSFKR